MFKVKIPAFESYRIGTRPAVLESLKYVLEYMDIDLNHLIFFNGEAEVSKLLGGEYNDRRGGDLGTDVGYDNKIFVELERDLAGYNDELDNLTNDDMVPPVWHDPMSGATLTPKYSTRKYRITVNKYFKDRVTAERFYTNVRSKTLGTHQNTQFRVNTHYPIVYSIMECLKEIHDRLTNAGQVNKDFMDWMFDCSKVPAGIIRNIIGNNPAFVFKQCHDELGINMENPNLAKVNKGKYIGKYEVSFEYWFFWGEHSEWDIRYPIQVWQQPMPEEFIPEVFEDNQLEYTTRRFFESAVAQSLFDYKGRHEPFYQVFPIQDNWRPPAQPWLSPQLQILVNVEDVDNQVLINIKEIDGFEWDETFLKYIIQHRDKVTSDAHSPLSFKVYSDDTIVLEDQIMLAENGDLILTRKPTMSACYRVTFNLDFALRQYSEDAIQDMLIDPEYGRWIIKILFPGYVLRPDFGDHGIEDWVEVHNDIEVGDGDPIAPVPNGMLYSMIIAHNSQTYNQYKSLMNKGVIDGTSYYWQN